MPKAEAERDRDNVLLCLKRKHNSLEGKCNKVTELLKQMERHKKLTASNIMVEWEVDKAGNRTQDKNL